MVSQTILALRATLAAGPLDALRDGLAVRLRAMLDTPFAPRSGGPSAVYGDADASVLFMIRGELEHEDILLRRCHR
jgi:hypothetical protein